MKYLSGFFRCNQHFSDNLVVKVRCGIGVRTTSWMYIFDGALYKSIGEDQLKSQRVDKFNFATLKLTYLTNASKNIQLRYTHSKVGSNYSI
jgi:hypothetical protein